MKKSYSKCIYIFQKLELLIPRKNKKYNFLISIVLSDRKLMKSTDKKINFRAYTNEVKRYVA
jgi:hypothetical protein